MEIYCTAEVLGGLSVDLRNPVNFLYTGMTSPMMTSWPYMTDRTVEILENNNQKTVDSSGFISLPSTYGCTSTTL